MKKISLLFLMVVLLAGLLHAKESSSVLMQQDSLKLLTAYSLFFEYHKNKDFESAIPHGWEVIKLNPSRFKNVYTKMEDVLWYMHDSTSASEEVKDQIADTTLYLYDMAIKSVPTLAGYYHSRKAFILESWVKDAKPADIIANYEAAVEKDTATSSFYRDRLGLQYIGNATEENQYKLKALELYSGLAEKEPDNPLWNNRMEGLATDLTQLMDILKKAWDIDKNNPAKAWKYAAICIKGKEYERAIEPLEFLVTKDAGVLNYWQQLATAYDKTGKSDKSLEAYKKVISLNPNDREAYINMGIVYKDKGQLSTARTYFNKALDVSPGWGYPVYLEGTLYEQSARGCGFEFEDRIVYQLAVDTYRRARSMDPSIANMAQERINALSSSVPTKEDYFFRQIKSGSTLPINGNCYSWIGKSITVP